MCIRRPLEYSSSAFETSHDRRASSDHRLCHQSFFSGHQLEQSPTCISSQLSCSCWPLSPWPSPPPSSTHRLSRTPSKQEHASLLADPPVTLPPKSLLHAALGPTTLVTVELLEEPLTLMCTTTTKALISWLLDLTTSSRLSLAASSLAVSLSSC